MILWASLALTPIAIIARYGFHLDATASFVLAAARADPARLVDRRGDRERLPAHRTGNRRLSERQLRQRSRADHRAPRDRRRTPGRRARDDHRLGRLEHPARARNCNDCRREGHGERALVALAALRRRDSRRTAAHHVGARLARFAEPRVARGGRHPGGGRSARRVPVDHREEPADSSRRRSRSARRARLVALDVPRCRSGQRHSRPRSCRRF